MAQHVTLSNGYQLPIPDGTPPEEVKRRAGIMESLINPQNKGFGSWADANETIQHYLHMGTDPVERASVAGLNLNPVVGGADLTAAGINAAKSAATGYVPSLQNVPDVPSVTGLIEKGLGTPQLSADASPLQRYGEAALSGALNTSAPVRSALEMVGATGGSDVGGAGASYFAGPAWEKVGRLLGSLGGASGTRAVNPVNSLAGPQASSVGQSAANIGVQPTFGSQSNTLGRGVERMMGALPIMGYPITRAQTNMEEGLKSANDQAAQSLNPNGPVASDPASIGRNVINAARTRSAQLKAQAGGAFDNLYQQLPGGNSTLVNAGPVIDAITQQAGSPNISAQQKADLLDRANYLKSMTYGQPGYNGPQFQGASPVNAIPIGQLGRFRSELGDDLNTMRGIDATAQKPVYDAVTGAMKGAFTRIGQGDQFDQVNANYAKTVGPGSPTEALDQIGGKPTKGGMYQGGMDEGSAYNYIHGNLQSPSAIEPLVDPNNPHWQAAAAGYVGGLGSRSGQFSAVDYGRHVGDGSTGAGARAGISDPVLEQLTRGNPQAAQTIRDASNVAANAAPIAHGGISTTPAILSAEWLANHMGGVIPSAALPFATAAAGAGMESPAFTQAMTQPSGPVAQALYSTGPQAYGLNNPDDQSQGQPKPQPWTPLSLLTTPQAQQPAQPPSTAVAAQMYPQQPQQPSQ